MEAQVFLQYSGAVDHILLTGMQEMETGVLMDVSTLIHAMAEQLQMEEDQIQCIRSGDAQ